MKTLLAVLVLCCGLNARAVPVLDIDYFQVDGKLYLNIHATGQPADMTWRDVSYDSIHQYGGTDPLPEFTFYAWQIIGFNYTSIGVHTISVEYTTPGGIVSASDTYEVFDPSYNTPGRVAPVPDSGGTFWLMCAGLAVMALHGLFPMTASSTKT